MKDKVRDRADAVDKIARIGGLVTAVRCELLLSISFLKEDAVRKHRNAGDHLREEMGQLWRRMARVFQKNFMCMLVWVDRAVYKAVRDFPTYNQGVQGGLRSKLCEALWIVVLVFAVACKGPAFEVNVRPEDVRGSDEPMTHVGLPAKVVVVTEEEC